MNALLPALLSWLQHYGYIALGLCVCVSAIGVPLPSILVLLAAGAFAALGDFNIFLLALIATIASICGDTIGYGIGRRIGARILSWFEQRRRLPFLSSNTLAQAHIYFSQHGGWAIFLTRFLFFALGGVTNIVAGAERYSYRRFLLYDILGEILGATIPLSLGYIFGASWEAVGELISAFSLFILALCIVIALAVRLIQLLRQSRGTRQASLQHTFGEAGILQDGVMVKDGSLEIP